MTQSCQKSVKIVYLFWNLHTLKCKENIYLGYMNINHAPVATRLMIDIKHQPDRNRICVSYSRKKDKINDKQQNISYHKLHTVAFYF